LSDLADLAKSSVRGSFFLFLGEFSSTIIMALASILIAVFLGPEEYGIYTIVFIVPSLLVELSDLGVSPALTRFSAHYQAEGKNRKVANLVKTGILFKFTFSLILSLSMLLLAEGIATNVLKRPAIGFLIRLASLNLIGEALLNSVNSVFIGLDKAELSGLLKFIQAIIKAVVSPLLLLLGLGVAGATLGAGLGLAFAAATGVILIVFRTFPLLERNSYRGKNINFSQALKKMISYGTPLYFSAIIGTVLLQYRTILLTLFTSNTDIGYYAIVMNFSVLMNVLTYPLSTSLFPSFSKLKIEKNRNEIGNMLKLAVKYVSLIIIPASLALAVLSSDVVPTLYGSQYTTASRYLCLYSLSLLYTGMGMFVIGPLINSQGDTKTTLRIGIVGFAVSIPLSSLLTPLYGVLGLITSILISQLISTSYSLYIVHQRYELDIEPSYSLKILAASLLSALLVYLFSKLITLTNPIYSLACGGVLYTTSFLLFAPILGAITDEDIENLKYATNELPIIRILAANILKIEKKILNLKVLLPTRHARAHEE